MTRTREEKRVLVFGVFDKIHPGHLFFLKKARELGTELIVLVARDQSVFELKGRKPRENEKERLRAVRKMACVSKAILGDKILGAHVQLKKIKPNIIALGYDQDRFGRHLQDEVRAGNLPKIKLVKIRAYRPDKYHTALLHPNKN